MADGRFEFNPGVLPHLKRNLAAPLAEAIARLVRNQIISEMEDADPRTGHTYLVPGTQTPYVASAPGEPPAIREGRYIASWEATPGVETAEGAVAFAFSNERTDSGDPVGLILELGDHAGNVLPRPHIRPALENVRPEAEALIRKVTAAGGGS